MKPIGRAPTLDKVYLYNTSLLIEKC